MSRVVDLTLTMRPGMRGVDFEPRTTTDGKGWNTTILHLYSHAGTHMDAPYHFVQEGETLENLVLEKCVGPAHVIDLTSVKPRELITVEHLAPHAEKIGPGVRLLLKTGWSARADSPSASGTRQEFGGTAPGNRMLLSTAGSSPTRRTCNHSPV